MTKSATQTSPGFTLVELLVVVAIIGVLIALLLPAVQAAREAARVTQCRNHLKQLALGCLAHENVTGRFPSGGGVGGTGDADLGTGRSQPGGWNYNILPYIEQQALHDMGAGLGFVGKSPAFPSGPTYATTPPAKRAANLQRMTVPLPVFYCPTRRPAAAYPWGALTSSSLGLPWDFNFDEPAAGTLLGRTDYAANMGDPNGAFFWRYGPIFGSSEIRLRDVKDGASNTYLAGEKKVPPYDYAPPYNYISQFGIGADGFDLPALCGGSDTTLCFTLACGMHPGTDYSGCRLLPSPDWGPYYHAFGSAHADGFGMAFCDGSVRTISYSIDPLIHAQLGTIADGLPVGNNRY